MMSGESQSKQRVRILAEGLVQGVGYRYGCQREAMRLGLTGWVRNTWFGAVEAVAEGTPEALAQFVIWCRAGSVHARVRNVAEEYSAATGEFDGFEIRS